MFCVAASVHTRITTSSPMKSHFCVAALTLDWIREQRRSLYFTTYLSLFIPCDMRTKRHSGSMDRWYRVLAHPDVGPPLGNLPWKMWFTCGWWSQQWTKQGVPPFTYLFRYMPIVLLSHVVSFRTNRLLFVFVFYFIFPALWFCSANAVSTSDFAWGKSKLSYLVQSQILLFLNIIDLSNQSWLPDVVVIEHFNVHTSRFLAAVEREISGFQASGVCQMQKEL